MILPIQTLTTSAILFIILLAGCSGCGVQSTSEQAQQPADTTQDERSISKENPIQTEKQKENRDKPKPRGKTATLSAEQFSDIEYLAALKDVEYIEIAREKGGIPIPWDPIVVPIELWKSRVEQGSELLRAQRQKKLSLEEYNEQVLQVYREDGFVTTIKRIIELRGSINEKVSRMVNMAYAENPDDFDTLLMWVFAGGNLADLYGAEKTAATRRLYEMNPDHPWVLHKLAKCLLGSNPQEALGYAQKAQELNAQYLPLGVEGACYYQMGDYEKALASFRRSHQNAVETSQPSYIIGAINFWVGTVKNVVESGGRGEDGREKKRKVGLPLLGSSLPTRLYR